MRPVRPCCTPQQRDRNSTTAARGPAGQPAAAKSALHRPQPCPSIGPVACLFRSYAIRAAIRPGSDAPPVPTFDHGVGDCLHPLSCHVIPGSSGQNAWRPAPASNGLACPCTAPVSLTPTCRMAPDVAALAFDLRICCGQTASWKRAVISARHPKCFSAAFGCTLFQWWAWLRGWLCCRCAGTMDSPQRLTCCTTCCTTACHCRPPGMHQ